MINLRSKMNGLNEANKEGDNKQLVTPMLNQP